MSKLIRATGSDAFWANLDRARQSMHRQEMERLQAQIDRAEGKFTWDELASQYRVQNKPCANKRIGQT